MCPTWTPIVVLYLSVSGFSKFLGLQLLVMHKHVEYQHRQAMHGWDSDYLANFPGPFSRDESGAPFSQILGTELHRILGGQSPVIGAPQFCFRFEISCTVSKRWRLKDDFGRKSRPNFGLLRSWKTYGSDKRNFWVNYTSSTYRIQPRIYFCRSIAARLERLNV